MHSGIADWRCQLRPLLVLGRVSNLPTVWSNCLAGWLLADGGPFLKFLNLCFGTTCLYIGGMYLNDAFDAEFDRQHRRERPIPSGAITLEQVWAWGILWLGLGLLALAVLGKATFLLSLCLIASILLYDAVHKRVTFSPVLMSACRFFLYLVAASAATGGLSGMAVWSGLVLALYIVGLSYVARKESAQGGLRLWPCSLLATPILLAWIVDVGPYRTRGVILSLILGLWIFRCLRFTFWAENRNVGRTVSGLLAGIVLVDLLAVGVSFPWSTAVFVIFFAAALLFQRFIPAT